MAYGTTVKFTNRMRTTVKLSFVKYIYPIIHALRAHTH